MAVGGSTGNGCGRCCSAAHVIVIVPGPVMVTCLVVGSCSWSGGGADGGGGDLSRPPRLRHLRRHRRLRRRPPTCKLTRSGSLAQQPRMAQ